MVTTYSAVPSSPSPVLPHRSSPMRWSFGKFLTQIQRLSVCQGYVPPTSKVNSYLNYINALMSSLNNYTSNTLQWKYSNQPPLDSKCLLLLALDKAKREFVQIDLTSEIRILISGSNHLGRKNWLFSQSSTGAKAMAIIMSILETAKQNILT